MGNSFSAEPPASESTSCLRSLNGEESRSLNELFLKISQNGLIEPSKLSSVFCSEALPNYSICVHDVLLERGALNQRGFAELVAKCSRGTAPATVEFFWDISKKSQGDAVSNFFALVLEFGNCAMSGLSETSEVMSRFLKQTIERNGKAEDSVNTDIEFRPLMNWINEFAPNLPVLLVTYINRICFDGVELLSFTPFCPPILEVPSSVTTQSRLLPLALYWSKMQGRWKRLYTTERDGISFNRVAHNILGYGVS
jgi:hypothetical protein